MKRVYEVITYDIWGNSRDGWDVNQSFTTGDYIEVDDEKDTDRAINRRLGKMGYTGNRGIEWDGEPDFQLFGTRKRNGKPVCELQYRGETDNE